MDKHCTKVTRRLRFCAAHRVLGHEDGCDNIHGHNWEMRVTCALKHGLLDQVGRVIDFKDVKKRLQSWVDRNLDHGSILSVEDPLRTVFDTHQQKVYPVMFNPTVEHLVDHLADIFATLLPPHIQITRLVLVETENCSVEWTYDGR